jgi:hypothetical protein
MKVTAEKNEKVANMIFASIYPYYLNRLEKKMVEQKKNLIKSLNGTLVLIKMLYMNLLMEKQPSEHFFKKLE